MDKGPHAPRWKNHLLCYVCRSACDIIYQNQVVSSKAASRYFWFPPQFLYPPQRRFGIDVLNDDL